MPTNTDDTNARPPAPPPLPDDISIQQVPDIAGAPSLANTPEHDSSRFGFQGQARFDYLMRSHPSSMQINSNEYDTWLLGMPEDPLDLDYTRLLRKAKDEAQSRNQLRAKGGDPNNNNPGIIRGLDATVGPPGFKALPGQPNPDRKMKQAEQKDSAKGAGPKILGLPVTEKDVFGDPTKPPPPPGQAADPYTEDWVKGQELDLSGHSKAVALKTGQWVYVGSEADPQSGPGRTRGVYSYVDEAKSGLANMSTDQIKGYERQLGLPETGMVSPELQSVWEDSVKIGQFYAQQGKRVELQFIFNTRLAAIVAKKKASGGGGAGSQYAKETPEDMAGANYYQAMMQILGDTSGVDSAKSKP